MTARALPPDVWALVAKELDAGQTFERMREELLADGFDVSVSTLARYRAADRKKLRATAPAQPSPALERLQNKAAARSQALEAELVPADTWPGHDAELVQLLRSLLADARERAERARSLGDAATSAKEARIMADLTNQLQRAEKSRAASRDVMSFSRADIEATKRSALEKVSAIMQRNALQGGLMCNGCGRALAAALAGVSLAEPPKGSS